MGKREPLDDGDECPGCERAPPTGYYLCPVCDAEYPGEDEESNPMIWQPIETAPRDGTEVIGFMVHKGDDFCPEPFSRVRIMSWRGAFKIFGGIQPAGWDKEWIGEPTHWMPIPKAPTHD